MQRSSPRSMHHRPTRSSRPRRRRRPMRSSSTSWPRACTPGCDPRPNGSHYTSSAELPLVPGIDGVGRAPDGTLRYFVLPDTVMGAMAEQTVIDLRRSVVLPEDSDPVLIAAAMNPAMSSWVALRRRISFQPGQRVLVLGATGNAGQLAVQIAVHLGAGSCHRRRPSSRTPCRTWPIWAPTPRCRSTATRPTWPAASDEAAGDVDVVIDYCWGQPTADAMRAIVTAPHRPRPPSHLDRDRLRRRTHRGHPVRRPTCGAPADRGEWPRLGADP